MHRGLLAAIIFVISLHGIQLGEAGEIIDLDFTSGTATPLPIGGFEFQQYVEDGVVVTAIPTPRHGALPFNVSFHLIGSLSAPITGFPDGVIQVHGQDHGAAAFSLGGQPFDLLGADLESVRGSAAVLDGFVGDTLRISAMFPGTLTTLGFPEFGDAQLTPFQFSDPAWRGITSFVFDTTGSGFGSFIDNVRVHVSLPPNWILGAVGSLMAMAFLRRRGSP